MKQVTAFQLENGEVFVDLGSARKAAQHRYDDYMTRLRDQLVLKLDSHAAAGKALEWIEDNFLEISAAADLKRDVTVIIDEEES